MEHSGEYAVVYGFGRIEFYGLRPNGVLLNFEGLRPNSCAPPFGRNRDDLYHHLKNWNGGDDVKGGNELTHFNFATTVLIQYQGGGSIINFICSFFVRLCHKHIRLMSRLPPVHAAQMLL